MLGWHISVYQPPSQHARRDWLTAAAGDIPSASDDDVRIAVWQAGLDGTRLAPGPGRSGARDLATQRRISRPVHGLVRGLSTRACERSSECTRALDDRSV